MRKALVATVLLLSFQIIASAEKRFVVSSTPSGATVEMNGRVIGVTPLELKLKDHFFNGPKYLWSDFLNEAIKVTVSKDGYVAQTVLITSGPFRWVNLNQSAEKIFYVINRTSYDFRLEKIENFMGGNPFIAGPTEGARAESGASLTTEEIVQGSLPSVVTVKTASASGSGFFITDTGILVTNRHVIESVTSCRIVTSKGEILESESIFQHPTNDLALIKVKGGTPPFPFLRLARPDSVNVGADVIAIGSPGALTSQLQNTVTKGIVSAFRKTTDFGVLVQTDVALNHGNSGGPLMNTRGEAIGVNTLGLGDFGKEGLNFAIYSSEILEMLKKHFQYEPSYLLEQKSAPTKTIEAPTPEDKAQVEIISEPSGAEIYVDGKFDSSTPSKLLLRVGEHIIRITRPGFKPWERTIIIELGTTKTFNAILEKENAESRLK